jgi:hypothetical protein
MQDSLGETRERTRKMQQNFKKSLIKPERSSKANSEKYLKSLERCNRINLTCSDNYQTWQDDSFRQNKSLPHIKNLIPLSKTIETKGR